MSAEILSSKHHPILIQSTSRLLRSAQYGARSSIKAEDTLYGNRLGKTGFLYYDIASTMPEINTNIINYQLFQEMVNNSVSCGVRLYHKPYILPTESKIFAAIYIPDRTYLPAMKLSKEAINKFREQIKRPALKLVKHLIMNTHMVYQE